MLIGAIAAYSRFNVENDPRGERDFGTFEEFDAQLIWKIDYYDLKEFRSEDPADPRVTTRVLTVMLDSEY